jgi:hypothetical protein
MNRTPGPVTVLVRGARWGLPWLCILTISASAAYGMTVALAARPPMGDKPMGLAVREAPVGGLLTSEGALMLLIDSGADPSMATVARTTSPPAIDSPSTSNACTTSGPMLYVGLNAWIHDSQSSVVPCRFDAS